MIEEVKPTKACWDVIQRFKEEYKSYTGFSNEIRRFLIKGNQIVEKAEETKFITNEERFYLQVLCDVMEGVDVLENYTFEHKRTF